METAMTYAASMLHPASAAQSLGEASARHVVCSTPLAPTLAGSGVTATVISTHYAVHSAPCAPAVTWSDVIARVKSTHCFDFATTLPRVSGSDFTGTITPPRELFEAVERHPQRLYWALSNIIAEFTASQQIFDAIQALYLSGNTSRDRQIADRVTALHRDALADDEHILPASLNQFADFFLGHPELGFPKITLTPDSTLRARWIRGPNEFVAVEFTGEPHAKLVAEIPRDEGLTASYFATEPVSDIVSTIRALGASLA